MFDPQAINPFRSPQWRLERAVRLADHRPRPLRPRRTDDHFVRAYRRFLIAMTEANGDAEAEHEVFLSQPQAFLAHAIHFHPDREWHALFQARILAREEDDQIAQRFHTSPEVIHFYEKVFYNVRDRMGALDWITKIILGTLSARDANKNDSLTADQRFMLYRLYGYLGGSHVLDMLLAGLNPHQRAHTRDECQNWFETAMADALRIRGAMIARVFESSKWNNMQLLELVTNAVEARRAAGTDAPTDQSRILAETLTRVHWSLAGKAAVPGEDPLRLFAAVEPRAAELEVLAAGQYPATLRQAEADTDLARLRLSPPVAAAE
jgi:hypothetical protein